jgi:putative MATE family efflux protein
MKETMSDPILGQPGLFFKTIKVKIQAYALYVVEPYRSIFRCFFPELIVAFVLYTLVGLIDAKCIAHLKSTACYASLGIANTLTFFINKLAEGISVGAVIMCGRYQGQKNYEMVGKSLVAALWATACMGCGIAAFFYFDSHLICQWLQIPASVSADCIPYLQLRALGIVFMFLFSALIGFLRGVKNTRAGMYCFVLGAVVFIFFDYALIFGMFGFAARGFQGSAAAFAIQYITMFFAALFYILWKREYAAYNIKFSKSSWSLIKSILSLSWPVTCDKAALQVEKLWLIRLIAPMGGVALGSFSVIRDIEALVFVPAIAFAQVVTLLASNEFGARHFDNIKKITKIILALACSMIAILSALFILNAQTIIAVFDRQHDFTSFASTVFPFTVLFLFFDAAQLLLAGALRGTGNVNVVMWVRVLSALVIFMPLSYGASLFAFANPVVKFIVVDSSFNVVNGLTSMAYLYWFTSGRWLRSA